MNSQFVGWNYPLLAPVPTPNDPTPGSCATGARSEGRPVVAGGTPRAGGRDAGAACQLGMVDALGDGWIKLALAP